MEIKMNQSTFERFARIILGGLLLLLASYVPMNALLSWIAVLAGLILMLTGLAGWCPIYSALNLSTKK
jgi:VIT1/CCC1 family predicted Fe2+/Mn2+ transporter